MEAAAATKREMWRACVKSIRMGAVTPAATDSEAIELAYRAGALSVREIAKQHPGVSHVAIHKRAKAHGWSRNLSAKVRKAVSTQLVSAEVSTVSPATERAAVEAAAATKRELCQVDPNGWAVTPTATDWEAIELAYRAGVLSVPEIAKQHGITHSAVQKRAKAKGWSRDLSAKVRKAVATQLVATKVATVSPATERAAIESAGATVVQRFREHRRDIQGQLSLAELLWQPP